MSIDDIGPALVVLERDLLIPFDFQRRDLEKAVTDYSYLATIVREERLRLVIARLKESEGKANWDRVMHFADVVWGNYESSGSDYEDMKFVFDKLGYWCDVIRTKTEEVIDAELYDKDGHAIRIVADDGGYLMAYEPDLIIDPSRDNILTTLNAAHTQVLKSLYQNLAHRLGIMFEVKEENGVLVARQALPESPNPVYAYEDLIIKDIEPDFRVKKVSIQKYIRKP